MWRVALALVAALSGAPNDTGAADESVAPAFEGGPRDLVVLSTAYTSGPESTGKRPGHPAFGLTFTGTRAREGRTIAVDPAQIPLGSLVYIEELGQYFIAEDTGGAIRGNRIDLFKENVTDAVNWGMRKVRVRVFPQI